MVYFNPTIHSNFKGEWTKKEQLRIDRLFKKKSKTQLYEDVLVMVLQ